MGETVTRTGADVASVPVHADAHRQAAIARLRRRRKFIRDLVGYIAVNGVLWLIWVLSDRTADGGMPWPAWVSVVWGFLLALDAWQAYGRWPVGPDEPITEEEILREMGGPHVTR